MILCHLSNFMVVGKEEPRKEGALKRWKFSNVDKKTIKRSIGRDLGKFSFSLVNPGKVRN